MINIKNKAIGILNKDVQTPNGMLYKGTRVRILDRYETVLTVSDAAGRLFYVNQSDISVD